MIYQGELNGRFTKFVDAKTDEASGDTKKCRALNPRTDKLGGVRHWLSGPMTVGGPVFGV